MPAVNLTTESSIPMHACNMGERPRVLVVMPSIPLHGMERANVQIMRLMRRAGFDVLCITESGWGHSVAKAVEDADCDQKGIRLGRTIRVPRGFFEALSLGLYWMKTSRQIHAIFRQYKPTHLYITTFSFFLLAYPLPGRAGIQTIFRLPNPPDLELHGWRRFISGILWRRFIIPRCDILVCNSSYSRDRLRKLAGTTTKIEVIYNSCPVRIDLDTSDAPRLSSDRFNVVYVGRIQKSKGVDLLYEAAKILVDKYSFVDFYLAGQHSWQNPFAESLIAENDSSERRCRISFLDQIEDVPGLLRQAKVHVCPSTSPSESFPNVVLEAKNAGIPSVVFDTAGLIEAVRDGSEGFICERKTVECLVRTIERYIEEPDLVTIHGKAARDSLDRYQEMHIQDAWENLIRSGICGKSYA